MGGGRRIVDTSEVKVLETRLDEVIRRLDELVLLYKSQDDRIDRARGFAASLNNALEARVRAVENRLAWFMGAVAVANLIVAPVLAVLAVKLFGGS